MLDDSIPLYLCVAVIVMLTFANSLVAASKRALDYIDRNIIKDKLEEEPGNRRLVMVTGFIAKPSRYHYADHIASFFNILAVFAVFNYALSEHLINATEPGESDIGGIGMTILLNICFFVIYTALADFLPKKLAAQSSEKTGTGLAGFQRLICLITLPLVWICKGITNFILRIFGMDTEVDDSYFSEDKVMSMLDRGQESGEIKEEGRRMIDSIFEFDDLLAYEIMTPRTDVFMIDIDDEREEYFDELMELTHSRIPVYEEDPDNIVGLLHIKDYLYNVAQKGPDNVNIRELLRPAYFVPETKNIDALFRELQKEKHHLAILIDEYGGFSGIVSVEDIIEQIVGDIDDEFDEAGRIIEKISDNEYIVDGNVYLDDLEEETGVSLESETSETIGGFIIDLMGEIPKENVKYEPVSYQEYDFTIMSVRDRRIEKVRVVITDRKDEQHE